MTAPRPLDPTIVAELGSMACDAARLMLAAKKLSATLAHAKPADSSFVALRLQELICQAGYLMDECARVTGATPIYTSADGWTVPIEVSEPQ